MPALDAAEQKVVENVSRYGWHCMRVASRIDDPQQITFAYTIGLEVTYGWPELICFGLSLESLHKLLANAINELLEQGTAPRAGGLLTRVVNDYSCRLDDFPTAYHDEHLGWALWFAAYRRCDPRTIRCLQLVWPDRSGRFPDDPACVEDVRARQRPAVSGFRH